MTEIQPSSEVNLTPIQEFYNGTNVLITGGTGFLGRVLLEKLLRSCPTISTIYLIIRNKKGKNLTSRIDELFDDVVFEELRKVCPKFRHKVVGIEGDCCLPELGLKENDKKLLINTVNVIFHSAATVRFDEKLNLAVAINVKAPLSLIQMAKQMKDLKAFMHVSTAYSNCVEPLIEEKTYPPPMDYEKLIMITESVSEKLLTNITRHLVDKWPNTYTFTKAIAESIITREAKNIPAAIFRPAIIISSYKEPIPAWINNMYGPTGICAAAGSGLLRTLKCDSECNGNMVPVDMCVNSLIAAAYEVGVNFKNNENYDREVPVYHFESSNDKPITWGRFMDLNATHGVNYPPMRAVWCYSLSLQKNQYIYLFLMFCLHLIPAFIVDAGLVCIGKRPMMLKIYKKIHKFSDVLSYFTCRSFKFSSSRVRTMIDKMSKRDQEIFFCDLKKLDWNTYFEVYLKGVRIYLMQDDMKTLDAAKIRWKRFVYIHQTLKIVFLFIVLRILWSIFSYFYNSYF